MDYKKIAIGVSVVIIAGIASFLIFEYQKGTQAPVPPIAPIAKQAATTTTFADMKPLPPVDEVALQAQLQSIITKGKDADCASITDTRYQFACHDFFKNVKK